MPADGAIPDQLSMRSTRKGLCRDRSSSQHNYPPTGESRKNTRRAFAWTPDHVVRPPAKKKQERRGEELKLSPASKSHARSQSGENVEWGPWTDWLRRDALGGGIGERGKGEGGIIKAHAPSSRNTRKGRSATRPPRLWRVIRLWELGPGKKERRGAYILESQWREVRQEKKSAEFHTSLCHAK